MDIDINDKLAKILQLKEQLRQEMASPEYQEVKKMERQAYLKNLNDWRNKAHSMFKKYEALTSEAKKQVDGLLK